MRSLDLIRDDGISRTEILCWKAVGIDGQCETGIRKLATRLLSDNSISVR